MTATVVNAVLLAAILATWMWTWWWNRLVVQQQPEPDYEAAMTVLTTELVKHHYRGRFMPVEHQRREIARRVVQAAFDDVLYREGNQ